MRKWLFILGVVGLVSSPIQADQPITDAGKTYHVPYKLTDTGHVMVRVKINGKGPFHFIVDTGAPILIVSKEAGKKLGLKTDKYGWAVLDRFDIEGGVSNKQFKARVTTPFQLEGMNAMNFAGVELHGVVGFTLLAQYRMEFDFSSSKMKWTRLNFNPPPPKPIKIKGGAPASLNAMGTVMKVLSFLVGKKESPREVPQGFLGVEIEEKNGTVEVVQVFADSPAEKAGLQKGDVILKVGRQLVKTAKDAWRETQNLKVGQEITLTLRRGQEEMRLSLTAERGL